LNASKLLLARIAADGEMVQSLDGALSARDLGTRLLGLTARFGVVSILVGSLPPRGPGPGPEDCESRDCWRTLATPAPDPDAPLRPPPCFFDGRGAHLFARDSGTGDVLHESVDCESCLNGRVGQKEGVAFRMVETDANAAGLIFFGPLLPLAAETRESLTLAAYCAVARMMIIDRRAKDAPRLSGRQLAALNWAAEGKTDREIAALMHVSGHMVDKYMRQDQGIAGRGQSHRRHRDGDAARADCVNDGPVPALERSKRSHPPSPPNPRVEASGRRGRR
jgi:hypothetical protein